MSYTSVEARTQSIIQALSDFDNADVTRGDFTVLDRGSPPYAVLWFGGGRSIRPASEMTGAPIRWQINIDVYDRYLDDTSVRDLPDTLLNVVLRLVARPALEALSLTDAQVIETLVEVLDEVTTLFDREGGGPHLVKGSMRYFVTVHYDVAYPSVP